MFKDLLREKDITGAQLGRRIGVSRALVSAWMRGTSVPRTLQIPKIAKALDVSVEEVIKCFEQ